MSRPAWARGLKHIYKDKGVTEYKVAPCVGAWIETLIITSGLLAGLRRALRGRVD